MKDFNTKNKELNGVLKSALHAYNFMGLRLPNDSDIMGILSFILAPYKKDITDELWEELAEACDSTLVYKVRETIYT